ncbi:calpain-1 catalytic subunit-like [Spea bombifrons]|uniref:calpain-1 catalytic subunit-like n=1 Tax=Spea bombifrons TaxID=233779 RepID=UPI00234B516A|nr:calpain-1 catalytic subunit-like [Spea bombifrons]
MWAGQSYRSLRSACLENGQLFVDPEFPKFNFDQEVEWKRPPEGRLFAGYEGDCWLLSSISSLTLHPTLLSHVVPEDQSFCPGEGYCGIFHFRLWQFGEWVDVVVDDTLPTKKGQLLYTKSDTRGEMWSALLEKAYAKVCGGYPALQGGAIPEALEDFTGGIAESVSLSGHDHEETWSLVSQSEGGKALMACYIQASDPSDIGHVNEEGLVLGHAYAVIGAKRVLSKSGEVSLLRLRNPWGFTEYKGPWSDRSLEWGLVSEEEQKELNLQKEDGEFWMLCEEFCNTFSCLVFCKIDLDPSRWSVTNLRGSWESGVNAGGSRRHKSFFSNPQFRIRVGGSSCLGEDPESAQWAELGSAQDENEAKNPEVLLQLLQTDRKPEKLHISCHVYRVPENLSSRPRLDRGFFTRSRPACDTGDPQNSRGAVLRASLVPGEYVVVPSTLNPNQEGNFLIRVYCEKKGV